MTLDELKNKFNQFYSQFNGKSLEVVDASNVNQCVDLAVGFIDWIGVPRSTVAGHLYASQIYTQPTSTTSQFFDIIPNSATFIPRIGDIVVFGGTPGHISVANGTGDTNTFQSFDQNYPTGSVCHTVTHNYDNPKVLEC